ncbi:MAG TPA: CoA-transferase [Candidatus Binatia bacterium]
MSKLCSLRDAIAAEVKDGMALAMGCGLESLIPFAASHEIIRQRKRNLTLIAPISDIQFDQLIGAGCAQKVIAAWVGNVAAGLGHNFRRAMEEEVPGPVEIDEHSNFTLGLGLQAAAMGLPYLPTRTALGSDFAQAPHFRTVLCPFSGEKLLAVGAVVPDLAILHVQRSDIEGNAHVWGNLGVVRAAAMAAKRVIITCEEIVSHADILSDPNRTVIPGFVVSRVVHEPFGSHPSPVQGYVRRDDAFFFEYHRESRRREDFLHWLQTWVLGTEDHTDLLRKLGPERIEALKPQGNLFPVPASYNI